jgi:hypothetical protein
MSESGYKRKFLFLSIVDSQFEKIDSIKAINQKFGTQIRNGKPIQ